MTGLSGVSKGIEVAVPQFVEMRGKRPGGETRQIPTQGHLPV